MNGATPYGATGSMLSDTKRIVIRVNEEPVMGERGGEPEAGFYLARRGTVSVRHVRVSVAASEVFCIARIFARA